MSSGPTPIPCGIDAIANAYGLFHCVLAADAMQQALMRAGIHGVRIELSMPQVGGVGTLGNIYADDGRFAGQTISTNGRHVGIEVRGTVFDNNHPLGTTRVDWLANLHTQFGSVADAIAHGIVLMQASAF